MEKKYFRRVLDQCTKAELIYWWTLRLLMVGGMIFTVVRYLQGVPFTEGGFNPSYKFNIANGQYEPSVYNALQMGLNLVGMFAFEICQLFPKKTFVRNMPAYFQNITALGFFLASFGGAFLNFYYVIPGFDKILHLTGCVEAVFISYEMVAAMQLRDKKTCPGNIAALAAFGMAFIFAAGWELFEFSTDQWLGFDAQHWSYKNALAEAGVESIDQLFNMIPLKHFSPEEQQMRFAIMDTMGDAVLNALGAIPMYLILRKHPYRHMGKNDVNRRIEEELAAEAEKETATV